MADALGGEWRRLWIAVNDSHVAICDLKATLDRHLASKADDTDLRAASLRAVVSAGRLAVVLGRFPIK